jgi:hypothetical protein
VSEAANFFLRPPSGGLRATPGNPSKFSETAKSATRLPSSSLGADCSRGPYEAGSAVRMSMGLTEADYNLNDFQPNSKPTWRKGLPMAQPDSDHARTGCLRPAILYCLGVGVVAGLLGLLIAGCWTIDVRNDPPELQGRGFKGLFIKPIAQASLLLALVSGILYFVVWARGGGDGQSRKK